MRVLIASSKSHSLRNEGQSVLTGPIFPRITTSSRFAGKSFMKEVPLYMPSSSTVSMGSEFTMHRGSGQAIPEGSEQASSVHLPGFQKLKVRASSFPIHPFECKLFQYEQQKRLLTLMRDRLLGGGNNEISRRLGEWRPNQ